MKKRKALDLYCCAGGASAGLAMAGFDVIGLQAMKILDERAAP